MTYTVVWAPAAEQELAQLWMNIARRRELTQAAREIDSRLRIAPAEEGESRAHGRRILLVPPLGVTFEVFPEDRIVRVLDVWQFEKRG
jgi:plasmid stabilization system protein ParE